MTTIEIVLSFNSANDHDNLLSFATDAGCKNVAIVPASRGSINGKRYQFELRFCGIPLRAAQKFAREFYRRVG